MNACPDIRCLLTSRNLRIIIAISILTQIQSGILHWLGPYLTGTSGNLSILGLTYTSVLVLTTIVYVVGGALADSLGRKKTIVLAYLMRVAAAFVAVIAGLRLDVFIVLVVIYEVSRFIISPASNALLYESVDRKAVGRALSLLSIVAALVQGIGAGIAGYLLAWGLVSQVLFVTSLGSFILAMLLVETLKGVAETASDAIARFIQNIRDIPTLFLRREILSVVGLSSLVEFTGFIAWLLLPLLLAARGLDVEEIGLIIGASLIARRIGVMVAGFVVDRMGPLAAMIIDSISSGLLFAGIAFVQNPWITGILFIVEEFFVMSGLAFRIYMMDIVEERYRASIVGSSLALISLASIPAPIVGSMLYSVKPGLPFLVSGIGLVTIGVLLGTLLPRTRK